MHSEFPVFFQNTGKILKNRYFLRKFAMALKLGTSIERCNALGVVFRNTLKISHIFLNRGNFVTVKKF